MAAGDMQGRGLICKHPSKVLKKALAHLVIFKVEGGISAALKIDAFVPSLLSSSPLMGAIVYQQIKHTFNFKITSRCHPIHMIALKVIQAIDWMYPEMLTCIGNILVVLQWDHASGMYRVVKLNHAELEPASSRTLQGLFLQLHPDRGHDPGDPAPLWATCRLCCKDGLFHFPTARVKELHL